MNPKFMDHFHAKIAPVSQKLTRPQWSVIIPTYNCARYLAETLESVLQQDRGPKRMEIIVIDDHSTKDDPKKAIQFSLAPQRIKFIRQKRNVGKVRNYESGLQASIGRFIHLLHGDDKIRPDFYSVMEQLFQKNPNAGAAFCRSLYINEQGIPTGQTGSFPEQNGIAINLLQTLYCEQVIQTPSMVVKRETYEKLGGFDRRLDCMEDWEMWTRIANYFPVACTNKILAEYRSHSSNATAKSFTQGNALNVLKTRNKIVDGYIDHTLQKRLFKTRRRIQSAFLKNALFVHSKNISVRLKLKWYTSILRLNPQPITLLQIARKITGIPK